MENKETAALLHNTERLPGKSNLIMSGRGVQRRFADLLSRREFSSGRKGEQSSWDTQARPRNGLLGCFSEFPYVIELFDDTAAAFIRAVFYKAFVHYTVVISKIRI